MSKLFVDLVDIDPDVGGPYDRLGHGLFVVLSVAALSRGSGPGVHRLLNIDAALKVRCKLLRVEHHSDTVPLDFLPGVPRVL